MHERTAILVFRGRIHHNPRRPSHDNAKITAKTGVGRCRRQRKRAGAKTRAKPLLQLLKSGVGKRGQLIAFNEKLCDFSISLPALV